MELEIKYNLIKTEALDDSWLLPEISLYSSFGQKAKDKSRWTAHTIDSIFKSPKDLYNSCINFFFF